MSTLKADKLLLAYDDQPIVKDLDLMVPSGMITALVGPNGCGKSTLLRGLARLLKPRTGVVYLDGKLLTSMPTKDLAKQLGILPQSPAAPEGLTVHELVAQGRYPYQNWFQQWSEEDERMVKKALEITNLTEMASRPVDTLSGGQRQRAWIAMTLAQDTEVILLDEPTTFLDIAHQIEVLHLLEQLNREEQRTIVLVIHDLNLGSRYAHHMVVMRDGDVVVTGAPHEVMTVNMLRDVFGVAADIVPDPRTSVPLCIPYDIHREEHRDQAIVHSNGYHAVI
ncbi:MAG: ABC transporter ATP-binding protein [Chloroflexi bacterium AL-W]|nr:ABC transporter ATP-binding protein [Chloroflexi bacterium AL-N1]NOK70770.1 ABC transporter ATP-binding protein [Chloroflexi bacterium AL-N10]NOK78330.1 ABC transporter ATP-binding protein [Chloroflexi bacterium AL-N5]NOK85673.1 ABC transporter ATP-binding protein [Chloroflexi bacterium AL-W]NOK92587.1 ABC transporter ATP-binding protein [Chloroflexi bacterium AL-N15]